MSKAAEVTAPKPMHRVLSNVDAMFYLAISIFVIGISVAIGIQ